MIKEIFFQQMTPSKILAIETSCDDTAAAVLLGKKVLSSIVSSQTIHSAYGGVVPELASRDHMKNIVPIVNEALVQAGVDLADISAIAYTQGPGLLGSLMVGCCFAKAKAMALGKPLISVNHMQAHVLSNFLDTERSPELPALCLTVSGGHTQLVYVKDFLEMEVIGETLDDAMGEAFDKIGKMMGLPYPAGVAIDEQAQRGDENAFQFPDTHVPGLDFSFSGIKTGFLNFLNKETARDAFFLEKNKSDICASIQKKLIDMAMQKLDAAVRHTSVKTIALAGGVAANSGLRARVALYAQANDLNFFSPHKKYCTDNAAMIGIVGHYKFLAKQFQSVEEAVPIPQMKF